jgi:hypothetical protein
MPRSTVFRSVFVAALAAASLPVPFCQSQDSPSVAEAARKARDKKKEAAKPTKVITDETLEVKKGDVQSAVAEEAKMPGAPATTAQPQANPVAPDATRPAAKDEKLKKELTAAKEHLKQALMDLDLLQRENRLDQDAYYAKPNYGSDTAGKQKLDEEQQQIGNKRQEVEQWKAKVADLQKQAGESSSSPSQP